MSAEDQGFKPWTPGEGEIGDLDLGGGMEATFLYASGATALIPQVVFHCREKYIDWALKGF